MRLHGHRGRGSRNRSPTYNSWRAAIERCHNPKHPYYADYGGRGIIVCDRWRGKDGFTNFLADVGERPKGRTLDREDVNGSYEPGNVRWATLREQRWNRRDMAARLQQLALGGEPEYDEDGRASIPVPSPAPATDMPF